MNVELNCCYYTQNRMDHCLQEPSMHWFADQKPLAATVDESEVKEAERMVQPCVQMMGRALN